MKKEDKVYKCKCGQKFKLSDCKEAIFYGSETHEELFYYCSKCENVIILKGSSVNNEM